MITNSPSIDAGCTIEGRVIVQNVTELNVSGFEFFEWSASGDERIALPDAPTGWEVSPKDPYMLDGCAVCPFQVSVEYSESAPSSINLGCIYDRSASAYIVIPVNAVDSVIITINAPSTAKIGEIVNGTVMVSKRLDNFELTPKSYSESDNTYREISRSDDFGIAIAENPVGNTYEFTLTPSVTDSADIHYGFTYGNKWYANKTLTVENVRDISVVITSSVSVSRGCIESGNIVIKGVEPSESDVLEIINEETGNEPDLKNDGWAVILDTARAANGLIVYPFELETSLECGNEINLRCTFNSTLSKVTIIPVIDLGESSINITIVAPSVMNTNSSFEGRLLFDKKLSMPDIIPMKYDPTTDTYEDITDEDKFMIEIIGDNGYTYAFTLSNTSEEGSTINYGFTVYNSYANSRVSILETTGAQVETTPTVSLTSIESSTYNGGNVTFIANAPVGNELQLLVNSNGSTINTYSMRQMGMDDSEASTCNYLVTARMCDGATCVAKYTSSPDGNTYESKPYNGVEVVNIISYISWNIYVYKGSAANNDMPNGRIAITLNGDEKPSTVYIKHGVVSATNAETFIDHIESANVNNTNKIVYTFLYKNAEYSGLPNRSNEEFINYNIKLRIYSDQECNYLLKELVIPIMGETPTSSSDSYDTYTSNATYETGTGK